jgi:alkanesulfonate monooxygenase SsuD/methylene tetrahydromethanopterin reductase-like flavin-dependent oxidoreductase (luciferase family)
MTIGLGILLLNLHNPVYTAETIATLDVIARGKAGRALMLGQPALFEFGTGFLPPETDAPKRSLKTVSPRRDRKSASSQRKTHPAHQGT